jgi:glutamine synthetase
MNQSIGVELEFCLVDAKTGDFVDDSVFANTNSLNDQEEFLADVYDQLQQQYIPIELIHSESGPGQLEVVLQYSNDPVQLVDNALLAQETIRALAKKHGCKALFLPKYDMTKAGNGMHVHMSIRNATTGEPLMANGNSLSSQGSAFVEGLIHHLPGLLGLTLPTVNSFRRVGPGCWTGSKVGWALEDKEAGVRVCSDLTTNEWNHVEFKLCDSSCNLYLALAALLSSGLQGIAQEWILRPSLEQSLATESLPGAVTDALTALKDDYVLMNMMGSPMSQAYLALRHHEVKHNQSSNMTLEDELKEALARS